MYVCLAVFLEIGLSAVCARRATFPEPTQNPPMTAMAELTSLKAILHEQAYWQAGGFFLRQSLCVRVRVAELATGSCVWVPGPKFLRRRGA